MDGDYSPAGGTPAVRADGLNNYANTGTGMNYTIDPVHAFRAAFTADLPFGRGRAVGGEMSKALDAVVGGWKLAGTFRYDSGSEARLRREAAPTEVEKVGGGIGREPSWFDTTGFAQQAANTRRSNPWYYDDLTGPRLQEPRPQPGEAVPAQESLQPVDPPRGLQRAQQMNWANPTLTITSSDFGKVTTQAAGYYGRQLQYSLKFEF